MPDSHKSADYSRLELTPYTRRHVATLCVAVIGCGALGAEAARLLGLLGVGSVLLIDHDRVESTNLIHSPYLRAPHTPGLPKALVLAESLAAHFPDTHWQPIAYEIADTGFAHLRRCALLFSCTDNALARAETAYAAHRLQLPMVDAGLKGHAVWSGRVAWLPGGPAACFLCQISAARRAELLSLSLAAAQSCATPALDTSPVPSTPTMASIVAGLQIDLGLRLHLTPQSHLQARAWELSLPLPETTWTSFTIPRSADCPWHDPDPDLTLAALPMDVPMRESLGTDTLELDWTLCLRARCATCRHLWSPLVRVAILRRHTTCPHCHGTHPHPIETLTTLHPTHPVALHTPAQLNLPQNHLFTLRSHKP
jgi:molybdopterin/thiamine biosynthesis adenylyltransferase